MKSHCFADVNEHLESFNGTFLPILNKYASNRLTRVKVQMKPKWFTDDIKKAIVVRDRFKLCGNVLEYKKARNKVSNLVKRAKQNYYKHGIINSKGNSKKLWQYFKGINCKNEACGPKLLSFNGNEETEPEIMTNILNTHFIDIAEKVTSQLPKVEHYEPPPPLLDWVKGKIPKDTYFFHTINYCREVEEIVSSLNTNKAVGLDDINAKYLKISATVISNDIADIINTSLCEQTFPDIWKAAKVIPLHRSGNKDAVDNYRPISILSSVSVLTERKQCVINENYKSEMKETTHGVPKGSILGPLLFLIYINDFSFCVPNCNVNMYADDTIIYTANSNVTEVEYILQRDIDVISNWCDNSRLVINIQKSCSMLLCSAYKLRHLDKKKLNISLQGSTLVCENNQKILGVTIDSKLIFDEHIKLTCAKIASLSG